MIDVCAMIERETDQAVTEETPLASLDVDSLEFLSMMLALSEEAGKSVSDEAMARLITVGDLARELA